MKHKLHTGQARLYWQWASPEAQDPHERGPYPILQRGQQSPQSEVRILPIGPKSPMSEVLILSELIPHGYHSNQLCVVQNIEATETVSPWEKV